jgi:hypothetical protein
MRSQVFGSQVVSLRVRLQSKRTLSCLLLPVMQTVFRRPGVLILCRQFYSPCLKVFACSGSENVNWPAANASPAKQLLARSVNQVNLLESVIGENHVHRSITLEGTSYGKGS